MMGLSPLVVSHLMWRFSGVRVSADTRILRWRRESILPGHLNLELRKHGDQAASSFRPSQVARALARRSGRWAEWRVGASEAVSLALRIGDTDGAMRSHTE